MDTRLLIVRTSGPRAVAWGTDSGTLAPHVVRAHYATLQALQPDADALERLLDAEERARADRFLFAHDRERYVLGHGFLRRVLASYTHDAPEGLRFTRGEFGKPRLTDTSLHFNFSDTKDAVLVGVALDQHIGVDLETLDRRVDHVAVAEHYFTTEEVGELRDDAASKRRFLELWTRKEAVLKASGVGLMDDLHALRVNAPLNQVRIQHSDFLRLASDEYHVSTWRIDDARIASVAASRVDEVVWRSGG